MNATRKQNVPTKTTPKKSSDPVKPTAKVKRKSVEKAGAAAVLRRSSPAPRVLATELSLSVQWGEELDSLQPRPVSHTQLRRWVTCTLPADATSTPTAAFTLRFVGIKEGRALNRDFRHKDYATNVLTFPHAPTDVPWPPGMPRPVGADIVICWPVVLEEAKAQKKAWMHHLAHLVIHGCLHGQGYDHETEQQAVQMESLETRLLKRFRIADPYTTHD